MANPYKKCDGCNKRHRPDKAEVLACYPLEYEEMKPTAFGKPVNIKAVS